MLDGRGHAVITDFGLAGISGQIDANDFRTGTPTYMAPEQLAGQDVTLKSDIYSLGLVLYEIFTGKRAFEAATLAELVRTRERRAAQQSVQPGERYRSDGRARDYALPRTRPRVPPLFGDCAGRRFARRRPAGCGARRR